MDLKRLFQHSFVYLIGMTASRAVSFLMIPVYARFLTPAEYGTIELIELCTQVATIALGLQAIGGAMMRTYQDYPDDKGRAGVVSSAMAGAGTVGLLTALVGCALANVLSTRLFQSGQNVGLIRMAFVALLFATVVEISLLYFRLRQRPLAFVCYSLVQLAANLGLNIYFIAFAHKGVLGFVLSKLITSTVAAIFLAGSVIADSGWHWNTATSRRMAAFGAPLITTALATFVIHFSDRFFLNYFTNLNEVGIYALAYKFAFGISYLVGEPFSRVWNATFYSHASAEGWQQPAARVATYMIFFLFFAGVCLAVFIPELLGLLATSSYARAAQMVPLLGFGYVAREIGDFYKTLLYVNKRSFLVSHLTLACAALNIGLNYSLIGRFGIVGAAWATFLTWVAYMVACWFAAQREHRLPFSFRSFALLCVASGSVCALGALKVGGSPALRWSQDGLLAGLFVGIVWLCGYFPRQERAAITGRISRLSTRLLLSVSRSGVEG